MDNNKLIAELEKTAAMLEAQATADKTASASDEDKKANFSDFLESVASEMGLKE